MAYHEAFWVAVAAAAPVIALANTVTITDIVGARYSPGARLRAGNSGSYYVVIFIAAANLVFQAAWMVAALISLLHENDSYFPSVVIAGLGGGLIYVLVTAYFSLKFRQELHQEMESTRTRANKDGGLRTVVGWRSAD